MDVLLGGQFKGGDKHSDFDKTATHALRFS